MDRDEIVLGFHTEEKRELARQLRRTMTPAERALWQHLRRNQLQGLHFRRQQIIDGFIADFYCHAAGLVIELDGAVHGDQAAYDAERTAILERRGLRVLRFHNEQVFGDLEVVLAAILKAARSTQDPASPSTSSNT